MDTSVDREACPLNLAPTTSTMITMVLGDALAVSLKLGEYISDAFPEVEVIYTRDSEFFLGLNERNFLGEGKKLRFEAEFSWKDLSDSRFR